MEEEFYIHIEEEQLNEVNTVSDAVELLFNLSNAFDMLDMYEVIDFFNDKPEVQQVFIAYQNRIQYEA